MKITNKNIKIFTLGHSNRPLVELFSILREYKIEILIDVRRFPNSRKFPHFNTGVLKKTLQSMGFIYFWYGDMLGAFRPEGYENYMESRSYLDGIKQVSELAFRGTAAILCAEKQYSACHRIHIADSLARQGFLVTHILDQEKTVEHQQAMIFMGQEDSPQMELF